MAKLQGAHVLIIPYPAQGHMLALLDLAHLLSRHGVAITVAVTTKNLPLLSPLLSSSPSIHPLVLPFPNYPSLPPDVENSKDIPPSLQSFLHLMHALSFLHLPLLNWAQSNPNPPNAIISDFFLGWTYKLAQELSIPRITFSPSGALAISIIHCLWRDLPRPGDSVADIDFPVCFPFVPGSPTYHWYQLSAVYRSYVKGDPLSEFIREGFLANIDSWGFVFNTFDDLEGVYLDHLRRDLGHTRVWAVGPLSSTGGCVSERGGSSSVPAGDLLKWLDGCGEGSVVYVCFGSQAVLSPAQAEAVAAGLEKSGAHFIWCMRGGHADSLPEGFEERTKGRGMVIRGWAPQVAVLSHGSVGSFLTHCGWNSILEGIAAGVALLVWPMGADQYVNARLLEEDEELRVAVRVCEGRNAVPDPDQLGRAVAESLSGDREERVKAKELRRKASSAVTEGGSSYRDVNALVEALNKLKLKEEMH